MIYNRENTVWMIAECVSDSRHGMIYPWTGAFLRKCCIAQFEIQRRDRWENLKKRYKVVKVECRWNQEIDR